MIVFSRFSIAVFPFLFDLHGQTIDPEMLSDQVKGSWCGQREAQHGPLTRRFQGLQSDIQKGTHERNIYRS